MSECQDIARPEYRKAFMFVESTMGHFDIDLSAVARRDVMTIGAAIECIDRYYDGIADPDERACFVQNLIKVLEEEGSNYESDGFFNTRVVSYLRRIREIINRRSCKEKFIGAVRTVFQRSEAIRSVKCVRDFIRLRIEESELVTDMIVMVSEEDVPAFHVFLKSILNVLNLSDDLIDARDDYENGELGCVPGTIFYLVLSCRIAYEAIVAIGKHPKKSNLLKNLREFGKQS